MTDDALNERLALAEQRRLCKALHEALDGELCGCTNPECDLTGEGDYGPVPDYFSGDGMLAVLEALRGKDAVWEMVVSDEAHVKLFLPLAKGTRTAQARADTLPRAVARDEERTRMRFTAEQYDLAIEALQNGKTQLEPDGDCCHVCHDGGHQAWECGFNPLLAMAMCEQVARQSDDLHNTLHYLAGFETWMGERTGPARIVTPEAQMKAEAELLSRKRA